ncbi:MAG: YjgP/YjgQ family permease, partial [Spirochaetaceae bacterium]
MMRSRLTLARYLAREFIFSFFVSFLFFFFIFFVNNLLLLIQKEDILAKNLPLGDILLIVMFKLPIVVIFAFPFGTLVGALMAVARLSSDNEVLAMRACGVSTKSIFIPFLLMGIAVSFLSFFTNDFLLPAGTVEQIKLGKRMFLAHPGLNLEAFSVNSVKQQNIVIITGDVDDQYLHDIVIFDRTDTQDRRVIRADRATVRNHPEQADVISLRLEDVFSQTIDAQNHEQFEYSRASSMEYNLVFSPWSINVSLGPIEMTATDVWKLVEAKARELEAQKASKFMRAAEQRYLIAAEMRKLRDAETVVTASLPRDRSRLENMLVQYRNERDRKIYNPELQRYTLEFHRKIAYPFACIVFVIFAFPLGLLARKSGRIFGFGIGLIASIVYWGLLFVGHELGINQQYDPMFSMWLPNIVVLAAGLSIIFFSKAG